MKDDVVISIIKNLILACQKENKQKISNDYIMASPRYILNQFIRQINIPANNWHVSKEAKKLWAKLTDEPMKNFYYTNTIHYKKDVALKVDIYTGNSKNYRPITLCKKEKIKDSTKEISSIEYNKLFTDDHITPVSDIVNELLELQNKDLTAQNIVDVLNKIHICRITKKEDKTLRPSKRGTDFIKIKEEYYKEIDLEKCEAPKIFALEKCE